MSFRLKEQLQSKPKQQESKRREFSIRDSVLVRDLQPGLHDKRQNGMITAVLGGPRYQVDINGQHSRQVHIGHIQLGIHKDTVTLTDQLTDIPETDEHDSSPAPSDTVVDSTSTTTIIEPLQR